MKDNKIQHFKFRMEVTVTELKTHWKGKENNASKIILKINYNKA